RGGVLARRLLPNLTHLFRLGVVRRNRVRPLLGPFLDDLGHLLRPGAARRGRVRLPRSFLDDLAAAPRQVGPAERVAAEQPWRRAGRRLRIGPALAARDRRPLREHLAEIAADGPAAAEGDAL